MSRSGGAPLERGDSYEDQLRGLFIDCCPENSGGSMSSGRDLERICRFVLIRIPLLRFQTILQVLNDGYRVTHQVSNWVGDLRAFHLVEDLVALDFHYSNSDSDGGNLA